MILVDTSVWIDFFRKYPSPEAITLRRLLENDELLSLTGLIYAEILQGLSNSRSCEKVKQELKILAVLDPASLFTYAHAASLYQTCRTRGHTIRSLVDCVNAAVAIENRIAILHKDRDYNLIAQSSDLKLCGMR